MKHLILSFLASLFGLSLSAQTAIVSSGGDASSANGSMSFSIGQAVYNEFGNGSYQFIQGVQQPYSPSLQVLDTSIVSSCESYYWTRSDSTYYQSGLFSYLDTSANGGDTLFTIDLSIHQTDSSYLVLSGCRSVTYNTMTFTANGIYIDSASNIHGCDSIFYLQVIVVPPVQGPTDSISFCGSYLWPINGESYNVAGTYTDTLIAANGCDSILTLELNQTPPILGVIDSLTTCGSYSWPISGELLDSSGTYTHTLTAANGCDSVVTLDLTISDPYQASATTVANYAVRFRWNSTGANTYSISLRTLGESQWQTFLSTDTSRILQNRAPGDYEYYIVDLDNGDSSCVGQFTVNCATDITYTFNAFQAPELGRLGRVRVFGTQGGKRLYDIHLVDENGDSTSALNVRQRNYTDLPAGDYSLYVRDDFGCEAAAVGQFTIHAMDTNFIPNLINAPNNSPNGFRPTWNSVDGIINYQLRVVNVTDGTLQLFQTGINDTLFAVTNLPTGKLYRFNVRSRYNNGVANVVSGYSNAVSRNLPVAGNKDEEGNTAESLANGLNVQVYPNPTNNLLYVQVPEGSTLRLIDLNGRTLTSRTASSSEEQLDLSALAAGVYLLEVNSEGQLYHERIVKE